LKPLLIDTHAHLFLEEFKNDQQGVIDRSFKEFSLKHIINVGIDIASSKQAIQIAKNDSLRFSASCGIHPNHLIAPEIRPERIKQLTQLIENERSSIVALGEIGLDYYRDYVQPHDQQFMFIEQIHIAVAFQLPIIIHCRNAFNDTYAILRHHLPSEYPVVFHCFSGDHDNLTQLIQAGYYVGIAGPVTFKNSPLAKLIPLIPPQRLLIETDAPYLAPAPYRGQRNIPGYVAYTASTIARLLSTSTDETIELTSSNAQRFFQLR